MSLEKSARIAVRQAINDKILVRPETCENCGKTPERAKDGRTTIQAHHSDYTKPLEVVWLCVKCHSLTIKRNRLLMREVHLGWIPSEETKEKISESMKRRFLENPKITPTGRPWVKFGIPRRTWYRWKEDRLGCRLVAFLIKRGKSE